MSIRSSFLRRGAIALTAAALPLAGWTAAGAFGSSGPNPSSPDAAPPAALPDGAVAGSSRTETYTGVTPCRILDTRGGASMNQETRSFKASGTLSSQGGSNACGVPAWATSIAVNLTAISKTGSTGYVRGWAAGSSPVNATMLNFSPSLSATNQVNIPLCRAGACPNAFTLRTFGNAHLVGDVVGYYEAPLYATIRNDGTVYGGTQSGLVSSVRTSTGRYTLTFDRPVGACAFTAESITWSSNIDVSADGDAGGANQVLVGATNASNAAVDEYFTVVGTC